MFVDILGGFGQRAVAFSKRNENKINVNFCVNNFGSFLAQVEKEYLAYINIRFSNCQWREF